MSSVFMPLKQTIVSTVLLLNAFFPPEETHRRHLKKWKPKNKDRKSSLNVFDRFLAFKLNDV